MKKRTVILILTLLIAVVAIIPHFMAGASTSSPPIVTPNPSLIVTFPATVVCNACKETLTAMPPDNYIPYLEK